ncbi:hypothetical protein [Aliiruegeria lutimaris]|uniref:hypothetical protein n=1 Tax=Aliiruegeria lutimaris TaxID=571298 RepID=UPI000B847543|nr:hypothetical protein [Aliiruegeria lutimaris]
MGLLEVAWRAASAIAFAVRQKFATARQKNGKHVWRDLSAVVSGSLTGARIVIHVKIGNGAFSN